jgi:hypothetical protein
MGTGELVRVRDSEREWAWFRAGAEGGSGVRHMGTDSGHCEFRLQRVKTFTAPEVRSQSRSVPLYPTDVPPDLPDAIETA